MSVGGRGYPLAALGDLRRQRVEEARAELAGAAVEARRAERRAAEAEQALRGAIDRRRAAEREQAGTGAPDVEGHGRWLARLRRGELELGGEAARLREEAARGAAREDRRRELLVEAERQLRTLERHRELWEAERRRGLLRAEELAQEELLFARPRGGSTSRGG